MPFGTIIELGILEPGATLDRSSAAASRAEVQGRRHARPSPAGRARSTGSAPQVQGKTACNGWTFWHYEVEGRRKPIDALREQARRQRLAPPSGALIAAE